MCRFHTYHESTMPIIEKFRAEQKVRQIASNREIGEKKMLVGMYIKTGNFIKRLFCAEQVYVDTSKVVEDAFAAL